MARRFQYAVGKWHTVEAYDGHCADLDAVHWVLPRLYVQLAVQLTIQRVAADRATRCRMTVGLGRFRAERPIIGELLRTITAGHRRFLNDGEPRRKSATAR